MMDIFKFRAWDKKYKYMNFRVLIGNNDVDDDNFTSHAMWIEPEKVDYECEPHWGNFDEGSAVFMQYTGFKDKNGKEIYEGDVIEFKHDTSYRGGGFSRLTYRASVIYGTSKKYGNATFCYQFKDDVGDICTKNITWRSGEELEVIGNIYDNPELLQQP
jgi:uncharacterized phage protein (TIGR01671 family)